MDIKDISNASPEEKVALLRKLAEIPSWERDCDSLYRELLDDASPEVRRMCLSAFWDMGEDGDMERIMEIAANDPDPGVRAEACSTLGIYVYEGAMLEEIDSEAYGKLRAFLLGRFREESEELDVRRYALESLGFDGEGEVADALEWAYEQPDPAWKASAVFGMGRSGMAKWADQIVNALNSEDRSVRLAAVKAASEGYCEEATPQLRNLALSKDSDVQLEAIWALGRAGGPGALETLEMLAGADNEDVSDMASQAIEELQLMSSAGEDMLGWEEDDEDFEGFEDDWQDDLPFGQDSDDEDDPPWSIRF